MLPGLCVSVTRMLDVSRLSVSYGKHLALDNISLSVGRGEIVVMLGANGAGKSSCLKALGAVVPRLPHARIELSGVDLVALRPHEVVEAGLALVPEDRGIFPELTVRENLQLGAFTQRARAHESASLRRILKLFPRLGERMSQYTRTMSGGERQMVAVGRALMSNPEVLLLDEPSLGLSPIVCKELFQALARIRQMDVGVLLVEQNARQALAIAMAAGSGRLAVSACIARSSATLALSGLPDFWWATASTAASSIVCVPPPLAPVINREPCTLGSLPMIASASPKARFHQMQSLPPAACVVRLFNSQTSMRRESACSSIMRYRSRRSDSRRRAAARRASR